MPMLIARSVVTIVFSVFLGAAMMPVLAKWLSGEFPGATKRSMVTRVQPVVHTMAPQPVSQ